MFEKVEKLLVASTAYVFGRQKVVIELSFKEAYGKLLATEKKQETEPPVQLIQQKFSVSHGLFTLTAVGSWQSWH